MTKLNCKNHNCTRASVEVVLNKNAVPVLRVKNRHDGKVHTSDFDFDELEETMKKLKKAAG